MLHENQYYYLPTGLELMRAADGRPSFQMLQMRYTGTALVGDQGDREFFNVVQIGVERLPLEAAKLAALRAALGRRASLDPLPISNLEAYLVMPLADDAGRHQRIGRPTGMEGDGQDKKNTWTKRHFTVRMGPNEAGLLWDGVEDGQLSFSIGYAYYADVVNDVVGSFNVSGDSASVASLEEALAESFATDSTASPHVVLAGTIPIDLDPDAWPDMCRRIDLNDGAPPAWAFLEVRCYDFANALRPDLAMKSVEIEATGVTGNKVSLKPIRFMAARAAAHTRQVRFPYAIDLRKPYRYRVTEYNEDGTRNAGTWTTAKDWTSLLDLTTRPDELPYTEHRIEVEADTAAYRADSIDQLQIDLLYVRDGQPQREKISWDLTKVSSLPLQMRRFFVDRETSVRYILSTKGKNGAYNLGPLPVGTDNYLHLRPRPKNASQE